ncbi:porin [Pseudothioclava nitratireducens]|uniref:porin n=1 Tax=Pseudothioclava nitratireducens TaxID=1928646 RepID=UPI0023DAE783|nr:porin [Defluviimonas nitratireducens]MDF1620365.1 porin [Defluviimonas nitratireducens]
MKKVLFATTALVFSAGIAAAEVTISGSANMGVKYNENGVSYAPTKKAAGWYEIDMDVVGTTETDSGLTFGADLDLDSDYASSLAAAGNETLAAKVFVSGSFGTFSIGHLDPMADDYGLTDIGLDGIGIDNVAEASAYDGSADARWDYSVGALTVGVSLHTIEEDFGLAAAYDFGTFGVAVTFDHDELSGNDSTAILLTGNVSGIKGELYYANDDVTGDSYGIYAAYTTGALTLEAAVADNDLAANTAYGVGAKYDLGGATLAGGVGRNELDETVADLGVSFKF